MVLLIKWVSLWIWSDCAALKIPSDWYSVSVKRLKEHGGAGLLRYHKHSLIQALKAAYPQHSWVPWRFAQPHNVVQGQSHSSKDQHLLLQHIHQLFPRCQIDSNYHYGSGKKQDKIQFDIFIPHLSLALEYNGEYHYRSLVVYLHNNVLPHLV